MSHGPGGTRGSTRKSTQSPTFTDQIFEWIFSKMDPVVFLTSFLGLVVFCLFLIKTASRKRYLERQEEQQKNKRIGTPAPRSERPGGRTAKKKSRNIDKFMNDEEEDDFNDNHIDRDSNISHSDSDYDSDLDQKQKTNNKNDKRRGTKWLAKQQAKEEKRKLLEAQKKERAEAKKKEDEEYEERKRIEKEEELKEKELEEERQRILEVERQKELEEYNQMKAEFEIEEEGEDNDDTTVENEKDILNRFIDYIKTTKMVDLEELASKFSMKTTDCIDRIRKLMEDDTLTGIIDDRGKFIYITTEEMEAVAQYINQKGRVSKAELSKNSGKFVNLEVKQVEQ